MNNSKFLFFFLHQLIRKCEQLQLKLKLQSFRGSCSSSSGMVYDISSSSSIYYSAKSQYDSGSNYSSGYKSQIKSKNSDLIAIYSEELLREIFLKKIYPNGKKISLNYLFSSQNKNLNGRTLVKEISYLIAVSYILAHFYSSGKSIRCQTNGQDSIFSKEKLIDWLGTTLPVVRFNNFSLTILEVCVFISEMSKECNCIKDFNIKFLSNKIYSLKLPTRFIEQTMQIVIIEKEFLSMKLFNVSNDRVTNYIQNNVNDINEEIKSGREKLKRHLLSIMKFKITDEQLKLLLFISDKFRPNQFPLDDSKLDGFNVLMPHKLSFQDLNRTGSYRFVIKQDGQVVFGYDNSYVKFGHQMRNTYVDLNRQLFHDVCSHAALCDYEDVVAAGKVIYNNSLKIFESINNYSGHYHPDITSLYLSYVVFTNKFGEFACRNLKYQLMINME